MTAPTINSVVLHDTIAAYAKTYVVVSSTVQPLDGPQINLDEECAIRLTATNDPYLGRAGTGHVGVGLVNVRWHARVINPSVLTLIVPDPPLYARTGPTDDLPPLTAGDRVSELYIFPEHGKKVLDPGERNTIELRGYAEGAGRITVMFDIVADVDDDRLDLRDQASYPLANVPLISVEN